MGRQDQIERRNQGMARLMCRCKFYQEECLREGQATKSSGVSVGDEGGLENLRKFVSRLSFKMTGNSSDEEGKNASGVHAHRDK